MAGEKFTGLAPSEIGRMRQVEDESAKRTRLVADFALDKVVVYDLVDLRQ